MCTHGPWRVQKGKQKREKQKYRKAGQYLGDLQLELHIRSGLPGAML